MFVNNYLTFIIKFYMIIVHSRLPLPLSKDHFLKAALKLFGIPLGPLTA